MWSPYRIKHLKYLLRHALDSNKSLDFCTHSYFKKNKSLGSKDRVVIKNAIYNIVKWKNLLEAFDARNPDELCELYISDHCPIGRDNSDLTPHLEVGFPKWLFGLLENALGRQKAKDFCIISNEQAPASIRVNKNKIDSKLFFEKHKQIMNLCPIASTEYGFEVKKKMQYHTLDSFKQGQFEPQDEASQIICKLVDAKPSEHILDFCAGSGGKSLGFAPEMNNTGQIHLHDIRKPILLEAKKRLKKAGVQNFQLYHNEESRMKNLIGNMDTVLVDAPCSCTGTFRRRPDRKWFLTKSDIEEFAALQKSILLKAIPYLKKGGKLIYATCSALKEENKDQEGFLKQREDLVFEKSLSLPLTSGGNDSMYICIFQKKLLA